MTAETTNLGNATARGLFWTLLASVGGRLVSLVSLALLARILVPEHFGLLALALTFIAYLETVGDLGTGIALIYWPSRDKDAAQVTFYANLAMGCSWFAVCYSLAPWVAEFFQNSAATPIFRTLAWSFPLKALGNTHDALSLKWMRFKLRLVPELGMAFTKAGLAVTLAMAGYGVWSLVYAQLAGVAVWTLGLWMIVPFRPQARIPTDLIGPMLKYGRGIVAVNILAAVLHHADLVIVGRALGAAALGFYQIAYKVPEMTITLLMRIGSRVLFPAFSKLQKDDRAMRDAYLETLRYVSLMVVPAAVGLVLLAEPIVLSVFGESWRPAVPLLRALAVYAGVRGLGTHSGDVLKATGRSGLLAVLGVGKALLLVPVLVFASQTSALAVASALAGVASITSLLNIVVICRLLPIRARNVFSKMAPGLATGLAVGVVLVAAKSILDGLSPPVALVAGTIVGSLTAALCVRTLQPELYHLLRAKLREAKTSAPDVTNSSLQGASLATADTVGTLPVLVPFSRFLIPIHDRAIVDYFCDTLLVPYTRWQRLTLPLIGRFGWRFRRIWVSIAGRLKSTAVAGPMPLSKPAASATPDPAGLVASLLGNGNGSLTVESGLEEQRPLRWMLLRDYDSGERMCSVAFVFGRDDKTPSAILKLRATHGPGESLRREWNAIRRFAAVPELGGSVPEPLAFHDDSGVEALLSSCLTGRSAYVEMYRANLRSVRIAEHFRGAAAWLSRFHLATRRRVPSGQRLLDFERLSEAMSGDSRGVDREGIKRLGETWDRIAFPVAASHGDYWARNLLLNGHGQKLPGVVDWEHYSDDQPFFLDLFHYPVTYGLNFPWGNFGRVGLEQALTRTFVEENVVSVHVRQYFEDYCRRTGLEVTSLADLFHIYLLSRAEDYATEERAVWLRLHRALESASRSVFSG